MKEKLRRLPDSELAVMQALWRADAPLTRPELDAALTHREWAATTVVALLARLEGKGFIAREKQGRGYLYRALVTQDAYLAAESRTLLGTLYGGRPRNFIAALHDADALTPNDIAELEDYLEKAKRGDGCWNGFCSHKRAWGLPRAQRRWHFWLWLLFGKSGMPRGFGALYGWRWLYACWFRLRRRCLRPRLSHCCWSCPPRCRIRRGQGKHRQPARPRARLRGRGKA